MNEQTAIELLKEELKKLVKNNVTVTANSNNYIVKIGDTELTVPRSSNSLVRKNILSNR